MLNRLMPHLLLKSHYQVLRHAIILLSVMLISINVLWDEPTNIQMDRLDIWVVYFLTFLVVIYSNMYGLVPRLLLKGKTKKYSLFLLGLLLFFVLSVGTLQSVADNDSETSLRTPPIIAIAAGLSTFILFIAGLTALQLLKYQMISQQKISELETATMNVELATLQNQINPHFLFNMLNNANIMAQEDAGLSSEILHKLNDLLEYQITKSSKKSVSLQEEIAFLNDYLKLEKMRRDHFTYSIESNVNSPILLPPLLFIPFVENAVKHNPESDAMLTLTFREENKVLFFQCKNTKPGFPVEKKDGGIGLPNIRQRLNLLFPSSHTLVIDSDKPLFCVTLKLEL